MLKVVIGLVALCTLLQSQIPEPAGQPRVTGADTVVIDGATVRLWGVSTFPPDSSCSDDPAVPQSCGELARHILEEQLAAARETLDLVSRQGHQRYAASRRLRCTLVAKEPDGERVGTCEVLIPSCYGAMCEDVWYDLASQLIESGAARQRRAESLGAYDEEEAVARSARLGGWASSP